MGDHRLSLTHVCRHEKHEDDVLDAAHAAHIHHRPDL